MILRKWHTPTSQPSRPARASKVVLAVMTASLLATACGTGADGDEPTADDATPTPPASSTQEASDEAQQELQEFYDAAQEAGEESVSIYTAANAADYADASSGLGYVSAQFEEQFPGVSINWTGFLDNSIYAQLDGQAASGNHTTDLLLHATSLGVFNHLIAEDRMEAFVPVTAEELATEDRATDDHFLVAYSFGIGLVYNTTQLNEEEIPSSLDDYLSPEWEGRFGLVEPNGTWPGDTVMATLAANGDFSEEQYADLLRNAELYPDMPTALTAVAQGRIPAILWAPNGVGLNMATNGAPVAVGSVELQFLQRYGLGLLSDAPNESAAKLFMSWVFTPEGQAAFAEGWNAYGQIPGSAGPANSPASKEFTIELLPLDEEQPATQEYYTDVTTSVLQGLLK